MGTRHRSASLDQNDTPLPTAALVCLIAAAVFGVLHATASLYWGFGGTALLGTLGEGIVTATADIRWALIPVALAKLAFAALPLTPLVAGRTAHPTSATDTRRRRTGPERTARIVCVLGATLLVVWGGLNTLIGNLVLAGVIRPDAEVDRAGMIGHAWLWDPMFLAWGLLVLVGLALHNRRRRAPREGAPAAVSEQGGER